MDHQFDSESYWNRSASVGFSFDEEDDTNKRQSLGGTIHKSSTKSNIEEGIFNDDTISEASFDNSSATLNFSIKWILSEEALKTVIQEQSMDDRIITKRVSPEDELKLLRRQIQTTLYNPSPIVTANKLLHGKSTPLEVFKSLHEKEELLDTVLHNGGGDAVISVVLFLKKTLNTKNFHNILKQRPKAFEQYISYLQQLEKHEETIQLLQSFGKTHEAALLQFQTALNTQDAAQRKNQLINLNESYEKNINVISVYQRIFNAAYKMHEFIEKEGTALSKQLNYRSTPIEVLNACCLKNTNWKDQDMLCPISPQRFCLEQQISVMQYEWTALNECARAQAYADLECIFERVPAWHPMKTKQFHISFALELAVQRLYELDAPTSVLYLFLSKMNNTSEKLNLAQHVKCTKAIIDAMAGLKQLNELIQLKSTLPERSEEYFYCENALKTLQSKRWMTDNIKLKL